MKPKPQVMKTTDMARAKADGQYSMMCTDRRQRQSGTPQDPQIATGSHLAEQHPIAFIANAALGAG